MAGAQPRLPDWLNPWWSETREIHSPMDAEAARTAIANASGFLKGSLGKVLIARSLTVFRESWWHLRRPWVVAQVTTRSADPGSLVVLRLGRTWFQSAFADPTGHSRTHNQHAVISGMYLFWVLADVVAIFMFGSPIPAAP